MSPPVSVFHLRDDLLVGSICEGVTTSSVVEAKNSTEFSIPYGSFQSGKVQLSLLERKSRVWTG